MSESNIAQFTYKPLGSGWFHCNQTGEKVRNTKNHRFMNERKATGGTRKKVKHVPDKELKKSYSVGSSFDCPYCYTRNFFVGRGRIRCEHCKEEFMAMGY